MSSSSKKSPDKPNSSDLEVRDVVSGKRCLPDPDTEVSDVVPAKIQKLEVSEGNYEKAGNTSTAPVLASVTSHGKKRAGEKLLKSSPVALKVLKLDENGLADQRQEKKHIRKRMKALFQSIVDQMEFYFSDANLLKDRFMKSLLEKSPDGYIDLSVFSNFNKLQSLDKDGISQTVLAKALRNSKMLQLNESESKVKRVTPLVELSQEDIDNRTVYVEDIPSNATHAWVKNVFSKCGKVVYISLPVYKSTKQIKEFAFVEFDTPEEAARACQLLNNPLPSKVVEKPGKFPKGNKDLNRLHKVLPSDYMNGSNKSSKGSQPASEPVAKQPADASELLSTKKKKKSKKKKIVEETTKGTCGSQVVQVQGSKKKKKKKKKKGPAEETLVADGVKNENMDESTEAQQSTEAQLSKDSEEVTVDGHDRVKEKPESGLDGTEVKHCLEKATEPEDLDSILKESIETDRLDETPTIHQETNPIVNLETKSEDGEERKRKKKKKKKRKLEKENADNVETVPEVAAENKKLSRKERKRLRQEDIRLKKSCGLVKSTSEVEILQDASQEDIDKSGLDESSRSEVADKDTDNTAELQGKSERAEITSILKMKKGQERKKVEFDPVAVTTEFLKGREIRKRKKAKKGALHLRVISKKDWLSLKAEYISQQKSHMAALKESLRELRQQESQGQEGNKHVDLEDVFGNKRLKTSHEVKMAHVENLKFIPNVIVQWKCSHDVHRDKIKTMFKEISGDSIAYIDAMEEAKTGYIRFKDETSAEEFAKMSRQSTSFMARVLPMDQQEAYWTKANEDRLKKLAGRKKEKGADKIARKVFERNKETFHHKPTRIVFADDEAGDAPAVKKDNLTDSISTDKSKDV